PRRQRPSRWPRRGRRAQSIRIGLPIPETPRLTDSQKGHYYANWTVVRLRLTFGAETRRRNLFIASQAIFRYYILIRSNQDHLIRTDGVYASAADRSGIRTGR